MPSSQGFRRCAVAKLWTKNGNCRSEVCFMIQYRYPVTPLVPPQSFRPTAGGRRGARPRARRAGRDVRRPAAGLRASFVVLVGAYTRSVARSWSMGLVGCITAICVLCKDKANERRKERWEQEAAQKDSRVTTPAHPSPAAPAGASVTTPEPQTTAP